MIKELGMRVYSEWTPSNGPGVVAAKCIKGRIEYLDGYEDNEELVDYAKSFIEDDTDFIVLYDTGELEYGYDGDGDIFELQ